MKVEAKKSNHPPKTTSTNGLEKVQEQAKAVHCRQIQQPDPYRHTTSKYQNYTE